MSDDFIRKLGKLLTEDPDIMADVPPMHQRRSVPARRPDVVMHWSAEDIDFGNDLFGNADYAVEVDVHRGAGPTSTTPGVGLELDVRSVRVTHLDIQDNMGSPITPNPDFMAVAERYFRRFEERSERFESAVAEQYESEHSDIQPYDDY